MANHVRKIETEQKHVNQRAHDLRHLAVVLAAQLPVDQADAMEVIDRMRELATTFLFAS